MDIGTPCDTAVTALGALDDWWPVRASLSMELSNDNEFGTPNVGLY